MRQLLAALSRSRAAFATAFLLAVSHPAYAQATGATSGSAPTFAQFVQNIEKFADSALIPFLYSLAFLFFIFGMFRYFFTGGEENRKQGKDFAIWSIVGFVVLFALWGIVKLLAAVIPT